MTTKKESLIGLYGVKTSVKVANNTFEIYYKDGTRAIRLHKTDVITYFPDGRFCLDSGFWRSHTTKARINAYLRNTWFVTQIAYNWYLCHKLTNKCYIFRNGMMIGQAGEPLERCTEVAWPFKSKVKKSPRTIEPDFKGVDIGVLMGTLES